MSNYSDLKYFVQLKIENVRCFGSEQILKLTDENENINQWTLIFGDNGVGKTTLLQSLAWMRPEIANRDARFIDLDDEKANSNSEIESKEKEEMPQDFILVPILQSEKNETFKSLPKFKKEKLHLRTEFSVGNKLFNGVLEEKQHKSNKGENIVTDIEASFEKDGSLIQDATYFGGNKRLFEKEIEKFKFPFIIAYGANRYKGNDNLSNVFLNDPITTRLTGNTELYDPQEILQDIDYAVLKAKEDGNTKLFEDFSNLLESLKKLLVQILPNIDKTENIKIYARPLTKEYSYPTGVHFETYSGEVSLSALSLGYQTTLAWVLDLAWRLYQNYPKSDNPLAEPAIVLIDEIDLHLHPKWQYTIMDDLSKKFTSTQFIATTHSPLMAMSNSAVNLSVVRKQDDEVVIENEPNFVKSWRVDQILTSELFDLGKTRNKNIEKTIQRKYDLLDKQKRTTEDEKELQEINDLILQLPTTITRGDLQKPDLVTRAANILKKYKQND